MLSAQKGSISNPLHPQKDVADKAHETCCKTVLLAEKLGVDCINLFSGCPSDSEASVWRNWGTCRPPDYLETLEWQWNEKLIPYWKQEAESARQHGVEKIAFEMHPGIGVQPGTLLRLCEAVSPHIGTNFDPSHLVWKGINPVESIKLLEAGAIFHVRAKDVYMDPSNVQKNGVRDTKPYSDVLNRSWTFRSVGFGLTEATGKPLLARCESWDTITFLIEHEDSSFPKHGKILGFLPSISHTQIIDNNLMEDILNADCFRIGGIDISIRLPPFSPIAIDMNG